MDKQTVKDCAEIAEVCRLSGWPIPIAIQLEIFVRCLREAGWIPANEAPDCDDCERIHPDDFGDFGSRYEP